jgi:uncharacterized protein YneF (UPF0154 family)
MNAHTLIGIILIVVGILAFAYQGLAFTTRQKVVALGPLPHMTAEKTRTVTLPSLQCVGGVAVRGQRRVAGCGK